MLEASPESGLRISMFAPWRTECGVRDYTAHLLSELDRRHEIESIRIVAAPEGAVHRSFGELAGRYLADRSLFRALGSSLNECADVAHIQHQYFLFGGVSPIKSHVRSFLAGIRIPAVMTVHEIVEARSRLGVALANRLNFLQPALRALVVHTDADRRRLIEMGCSPAAVHRLRHPVPPARPMPDPAAARAACEQAYPALRDHRIVTLFGFLSRKKGHSLALAALAHLPDDVALLFAGGRHPDDTTDYVASIESEIDRRGLRGRVVLTGYLGEERVPEIMAATEVAAAPYLTTSGSGSLANLLAYGRAIVASDIEPHRELTADNPGLLALAPITSPEALAAALEAVLSDSDRKESLELASRAYAEDHGYDRMAAELAEIYLAVRNGALPR